MEEQLEQEPAQDPYPGQEPPLEEEPAQGQELTSPLWPDQVVVVNSFDTWRAERVASQLRLGYEAAGNAVEAAIMKASLETAERDVCCRAFMAAERAAYADLNAVAAERHGAGESGLDGGRPAGGSRGAEPDARGEASSSSQG